MSRRWRLVSYVLIGLLIGLFIGHQPAQASPLIHQCTNDDPCTAAQMLSYNETGTNGFVQLNPKYVFPAHFRDMLINAHHQLVSQGVVPPWTDPNCGWWTCFRDGITCMGGIAVNNYWSCNGAYTDAKKEALTHQLDKAQRVELACGATAAVGYFLSGPVGMVAGMELCHFNAWLGVGEDSYGVQTR